MISSRGDTKCTLFFSVYGQKWKQKTLLRRVWLWCMYTHALCICSCLRVGNVLQAWWKAKRRKHTHTHTHTQTLHPWIMSTFFSVCKCLCWHWSLSSESCSAAAPLVCRPDQVSNPLLIGGREQGRLCGTVSISLPDWEIKVKGQCRNRWGHNPSNLRDEMKQRKMLKRIRIKTVVILFEPRHW